MENDERKNRYFVVYYPKINIVISAAILFQWQYLLVKDGDKVMKKIFRGIFLGILLLGCLAVVYHIVHSIYVENHKTIEERAYDVAVYVCEKDVLSSIDPIFEDYDSEYTDIVVIETLVPEDQTDELKEAVTEATTG